MARSRPLRFLAVLALVALLTLATQIGGLLLWLLWPAFAVIGCRVRSRAGAVIVGLGLFAVTYLAFSQGPVRWLAPLAGRDALPCFAADDRPLGAASVIFCLANRNFARPRVVALLDALVEAQAGAHPGSRLLYLDAGFPFWDGFPMLPHLSHRDGRAVDLALYYQDRVDGRPTAPPSPVGYWAFAPSDPPNRDSCARRLVTLRWDLAWLQPYFSDQRLDAERTGTMLHWLVREGPARGPRKVLIEPYLRDRFGLPATLFRFQGCRAARHDDHVHLLVK